MKFQLHNVFLFSFSCFFAIGIGACTGGFEALSLSSDSILKVAEPPSPIPPVPQPPKYVMAAIATGHMGRSIMSCDDGETWIKDRTVRVIPGETDWPTVPDRWGRTDGLPVSCWQDRPGFVNVECAHTPYSAHGLTTSNDGWFYATFGWGYNGSIRKSEDGFNWTAINEVPGWGGDSAFIGNRLVPVIGNPFFPGTFGFTTDRGQTWNRIPQPSSFPSYPQALAVGDLLVITGRDGPVAVSKDLGQNWSNPPGLKAEHVIYVAQGPREIVAVGHKFNVNNYSLYSSRSTDGGLNWSTKVIDPAIGRSFFGGLFFDARLNKFVTWTGYDPGVAGISETWLSVDGQVWERQVSQIDVGSGFFGPIGYNSLSGRYVAVSQGAFENQKAFVSTDALNWRAIAPDKFTPGNHLLYLLIAPILESACKP